MQKFNKKKLLLKFEFRSENFLKRFYQKTNRTLCREYIMDFLYKTIFYLVTKLVTKILSPQINISKVQKTLLMIVRNK